MKTAFVTSGGGAKGAFAAGVMAQLSDDDLMTDFDIVTGTSGGAIVAPFAFTGRHLDLILLFSRMSSQDLFQQQGPADIVSSGHVLDVTGLEEQIRQAVDDQFFDQIRARCDDGAQLILTSVQLESGQLTYFFMGPEPKHDPDRAVVEIDDREGLLQAVMASAAIPVMFPPRLIEGGTFVDGGVREMMPLEVAILNHATDIVGVVLTPEGGDLDDEVSDLGPGLLDRAGRTVSLLLEEILRNDIDIANTYSGASQFLQELKERLQEELPDQADVIDRVVSELEGDNPFTEAEEVNLHLIYPAKALLEDSLKFTPDDMSELIFQGRQQTRAYFESSAAPGKRMVRFKRLA